MELTFKLGMSAVFGAAIGMLWGTVWLRWWGRLTPEQRQANKLRTGVFAVISGGILGALWIFLLSFMWDYLHTRGVG